MIKISLKFKLLTQKDGIVVLKISDAKNTVFLDTSYRIFANEWDPRKSTFILQSNPDRNEKLSLFREYINRDIDRLKIIENNFKNSLLSYNLESIKEEFFNFSKNYTLFKYMNKLILFFKANGRIRTSETYSSPLNNFKKYRKNNDIRLDLITPDLLEKYQEWQIRRGVTLNTSSFYMRILKAVYNHAIKKDIIPDYNPFKNVYTGISKTIKRALPINIVRKLALLNLPALSSMDYARDIFMFSFYFRGMSFVDMAFLKKSDLINNQLIYRRKKTGQLMKIGWTREMQMLLNKYKNTDSEFLLPILTTYSPANSRQGYLNESAKINYNLKKIAKMIKINMPLTLYVARHSWATIAKKKGVPLSVISEGMGHESEKTTQIYLSGLDNTVVDKANTVVIRALR